jgi:hypothetical protein
LWHPHSRFNFDSISLARESFASLMKKYLMLAAGFLSLSVPAGALEIPRSVHRVTDVSKASEEAAKSKRGILWILSDSNLKPT